MKINISLPRPMNSETGVQGVRSFLKQLELSVHHAQKSIEEMAKMAKESDASEDFSVLYRVGYVEDSNTGEKLFDTEGKNPYTDDIEIEIYN